MHAVQATVDAYLASLPDDRREALIAVRATILEHLPEGVEEVMNWGMITYQIPLSVTGKTYNGKPLMYAALASQKRHMAVYLMTVYCTGGQEAFEARYRATGKRPDMGKSCVRFKRLDDLPLPLIGEVIGATTMQAFVDHHFAARAAR